MERLKDTAVEFLALVASGKIHEAYDRYVALDFRHHNPWFAGDRQSLLEAMEANERENPGKSLDVKRALEDEDAVAVFSHMRPTPDHQGFALVHIFRFVDGKIVELWDIGQPVPENSPNENGLF